MNYFGELLIYSAFALLSMHWIPWLVLLAVLGGCSRGMTGCAVGAVTGASVGANATGAIVFGTLVGCTVGYNL